MEFSFNNESKIKTLPGLQKLSTFNRFSIMGLREHASGKMKMTSGKKSEKQLLLKKDSVNIQVDKYAWHTDTQMF